jgi:hypothetical protein
MPVMACRMQRYLLRKTEYYQEILELVAIPEHGVEAFFAV